MFILQSYNDVAEDMRGDDDTKAELHQQLDVRNTNINFLFVTDNSTATTIVNIVQENTPISVFL